MPSADLPPERRASHADRDRVVDVLRVAAGDGLRLVHCRLKDRQPAADPATPVTLRVDLTGQKTHGRMVVRPARRSFADRLLRRPGPRGQ